MSLVRHFARVRCRSFATLDGPDRRSRYYLLQNAHRPKLGQRGAEIASDVDASRARGANEKATGRVKIALQREELRRAFIVGRWIPASLRFALQPFELVGREIPIPLQIAHGRIRTARHRSACRLLRADHVSSRFEASASSLSSV